MSSGIWVFGRQAGKVVLIGEKPLPTKQLNNHDAAGEVRHEGHVLRLYDGVAQRCLTCGTIGLLDGDVCDKIQSHNEAIAQP